MHQCCQKSRFVGRISRRACGRCSVVALRTGVLLAVIAGLAATHLRPAPALAGPDEAGPKSTDPADATTLRAVPAAVDRFIERELQKSGTSTAPLTSDEDFLRRITFDLAGTAPSPAEVTLFGLNPDPDKRLKLADQLLAADDFAQNWARYWRDVIFSRATDMRSRLAQPAFEEWMTEQLKQNRPWDEIATALITASGDVRENGETALIFAHGGEAAEIASETSRIFLGIQIQCANCHDHPTDVWKREQFHQLAAYFPRVRVRRVQDSDVRSFEVVSFDAGGRNRGNRFNPQFLFRRLDGDRDGKLTKEEVKDSPLSRFFDRLLQQGDANADKALSLAELQKVQPPANRGRGSVEYYMPDLSDPSSRGTRVDPVFFVDDSKSGFGVSDKQRRGELAVALTSKENPWFARAFVNRIWSELIGTGFYMPVDDIGPERLASFPQVLDLLADGFRDNDYDVKWLFRTIVGTRAYQREIRARDASDFSPPFAAATPTRLRADQLYNALVEVLGVPEQGPSRGQRPGGLYGRPGSQRAQFALLFGFDPSTPQEDVTGSVPQALFLMNSPLIDNMIRGSGNTRLGRILRDFDDDRDALGELYLLALSREPSPKEVTIAMEYIEEVGGRREAFEDLMWSLLNSSEFLSKR